MISFIPKQLEEEESLNKYQKQIEAIKFENLDISTRFTHVAP